MKRNFSELVGEKYNYLEIIEYIGKNKHNAPMVKCKCRCGNITSGAYYNIKYGTKKSCGCFRSAYVANKNRKHGLSKCEIYPIWKTITQRCSNPNNKDYKYYGAVGVVVDARWADFANFYDDMYSSYLEHVKLFGRDNTSLDRLDPNGIYSKDNCRWATWKEQNKKSHKRNFKDNTEVNSQIAKG